MSEKDRLSLKWGTLKGWRIVSDSVREAAERYEAAGEVSASAMAQRDNQEQKAALCDWADAVEKAGGSIYNDWSGENMTAAEAREYIMGYDR